MDQSRWYRDVTRYMVSLTLIVMTVGLLIQVMS